MMVRGDENSIGKSKGNSGAGAMRKSRLALLITLVVTFGVVGNSLADFSVTANPTTGVVTATSDGVDIFNDFHAEVEGQSDPNIWTIITPKWIKDTVTGPIAGEFNHEFIIDPAAMAPLPETELTLTYSGDMTKFADIDYTFTLDGFDLIKFGNATIVPEIPAGAVVPLGFVLLGGILYLRRRRISVQK